MPVQVPVKLAEQQSATETLDSLRSLLIGDEIELLGELEQQTREPRKRSQNVAEVLPQAILQCSKKDPEQFVRSLAPTIQEVLTETVARDPQAISDALYPIMGPTIRKSIRETLKSMLASFETALENSVSPQSFKWRIQAWRTGKPFSEILLLNSLEYQVEQAFLIQSESGLLLSHVQSRQAIIKDPDMVSGMLTAIQDFIVDSFSSAEENLSSMSLGELTVRLYQSPYATLAIVIRGEFSSAQSDEIQAVMERVHEQFGQEIKNYSGDTSLALELAPSLEECLVSRLKKAATQQQKRGPSWGMRFVILLLLVLVSFGVYNVIQENRKWADFEEAIKAQPGWFLQELDREQGKVVLWRDVFSQTVDVFLSEHYSSGKDAIGGVTGDAAMGEASFAAALDWQQRPFLSLQDDILVRRLRITLDVESRTRLSLKQGVLKLHGEAKSEWLEQLDRARGVGGLAALGITRVDTADLKIEYPPQISLPTHKQILDAARAKLDPPEGVEISLSDAGVLFVRGEATAAWIKQAQNTPLENVQRLDMNDLKNLNVLYQKALEGLRSLVFYFEFSSASRYTNDSQRVKQASLTVKRYLALASKLGVRGKVSLQGYVDNVGSYAYNKLLANKRALFIYSKLLQYGVDTDRLEILEPANTGVLSRAGISTGRLRKVVLDVSGF